MKLPVIELKDHEIVNLNGEFEKKITNVERRPLYFTNYSLKVGKEYGILKDGLEQELFAMLAVVDQNAIKSLASDEEVDAAQVIALTQFLSLDHMKNIIWLSYIGAQPGECYSLDEFKEKYDEDFQTILQVYMEILTANFKDVNKPNQFKAGLTKSLGKFEGKK